MKELSLETMNTIDGQGGNLALFACGVGVGIMIFQPYSVFAIGEATAIACAAGLASL